MQQRNQNPDASFLGHWLRNRGSETFTAITLALKQAQIVPDDTMEEEAEFWKRFLAEAKASLEEVEDLLDPDLVWFLGLVMLLGTDCPQHHRAYLLELVVRTLSEVEPEFVEDHLLSIVPLKADALEEFPDLAFSLSIAILRTAKLEGFFENKEKKRVWLKALQESLARTQVEHSDRLKATFEECSDDIPEELHPLILKEFP